MPIPESAGNSPGFQRSADMKAGNHSPIAKYNGLRRLPAWTNAFVSDVRETVPKLIVREKHTGI